MSLRTDGSFCVFYFLSLARPKRLLSVWSSACLCFDINRRKNEGARGQPRGAERHQRDLCRRGRELENSFFFFFLKKTFYKIKNLSLQLFKENDQQLIKQLKFTIQSSEGLLIKTLKNF